MRSAFGWHEARRLCGWEGEQVGSETGCKPRAGQEGLKRERRADAAWQESAEALAMRGRVKPFPRGVLTLFSTPRARKGDYCKKPWPLCRLPQPSTLNPFPSSKPTPPGTGRRSLAFP